MREVAGFGQQHLLRVGQAGYAGGRYLGGGELRVQRPIGNQVERIKNQGCDFGLWGHFVSC